MSIEHRRRGVHAALVAMAMLVSVLGAARALADPPHFYKRIGSGSTAWGSCPEGCPTIRFRIKKGAQALCDAPVSDSDASHSGTPWHFTWKDQWGTGEGAQIGTGGFSVECSCDGGTSWHTAATYSVFEFTLTVDKSFIMAGAKADDVHRTAVTANVTPSTLTGTVTFSVVPGTGAGKEIAASLSESAVALTEGEAQMTLASGDAIELIDVQARFYSGQEITRVWATEPDCVWDIDPEYLEETSSVTVTLTLDGQAVVGHSLTFEVVEVLLTTGEYQDQDLGQYASYDAPATVTTDAEGRATATLRAGENVGDCEIIFLTIVDNDIWYYSGE
jgi:hypothetical protein